MSEQKTRVKKASNNHHGDKKSFSKNDQTQKQPFSECSIKTECGACKYVNEDYKKSLETKFQDGISILRDHGAIDKARVLSATASPKPLAYRTATKLAVRRSKLLDSSRRFDIGLFKPGTHEVVDISCCPLHAPVIGKFVRSLKKELDQSNLTPWDEVSSSGDIKYIAIRASHITNEMMVTFVVSHFDCRTQLKSIIKSLQNAGHPANSAHINLHQDHGNRIFGDKTQRIVGQNNLRTSICELKFEISPTSFFQINPWQAQQLYRRVEQLIASPSKSYAAWDLYCGSGQISMILARAGFKVLGIEENPKGIEDGQANVRRNDLADQIEFITGRVEDVGAKIPDWAKHPSLIVANPSRRGMAEQTRADLIKTMKDTQNCQLIYVSCDVNSLARDLKHLQSSGYKVRQVEAFDMFAQTDKLEWIAVLTP